MCVSFFLPFLQGNDSSKAEELPLELDQAIETSFLASKAEEFPVESDQAIENEIPGLDDSHEVFSMTIGQVTKNVKFLRKEGF